MCTERRKAKLENGSDTTKALSNFAVRLQKGGIQPVERQEKDQRMEHEQYLLQIKTQTH